MITASQAKAFTAIAREKNFEEDFLKIDKAIRQATDRGLTKAVINVDELAQMKEAAFSRTDMYQMLTEVLLPLGYSLDTSCNYKSIYIEWK